ARTRTASLNCKLSAAMSPVWRAGVTANPGGIPVAVAGGLYPHARGLRPAHADLAGSDTDARARPGRAVRPRRPAAHVRSGPWRRPSSRVASRARVGRDAGS